MFSCRGDNHDVARLLEGKNMHVRVDTLGNDVCTQTLYCRTGEYWFDQLM